jgi:hypothetical protein
MGVRYNISNLPDDLPAGEYDIRLDHVRYVVCRDGSTDLVFETSYRGPRSETDPSLLHFTKLPLSRGRCGAMCRCLAGECCF